MPNDRDFKKLVRRRMSKTGESYSSARAHLRRPSQTEPPDPGDLVPPVAFDRLTEPAKVALSRAQAEAGSAGVGSIGTEYLVIGLMRSRRGVAAKALRNLGIRLPRLREAVARHRKSAERSRASTVPAETRQVIEDALGQADALGQFEVWTAQLLGAVLAAGEVLGARILSELGVTSESAAAEMSRVCAVDGPELVAARPPGPAHMVPQLPATGGVLAMLQAARSRAQTEGAQLLRSDHLISAIISSPSSLPAVQSLLRSVGTDLTVLRAKLTPPQSVTRLEGALKVLQEQRARGGSVGTVQAASLRDRELELRRKLTAELDQWQAGWG